VLVGMVGKQEEQLPTGGNSTDNGNADALK